MCYAKPGPRCSRHARKSLKTAQKVYDQEQTLENYTKLQDAKKDYLMSPAGIKELRERGKDVQADVMQQKYNEQLVAYKNTRPDTTPRGDPNYVPDKMFDEPVLFEGRRPGVYRNGYHDHIYQIGEETFLLVTDKRGQGYSNASKNEKDAGFMNYWYEERGEMTAVVKVNSQPGSSPDQELVLCDIEVRDGYQGQGKTKNLIKYVEKIHGGAKMHTTGYCTPAGFKAFYGKVPIQRGENWIVMKEDMKFIENDECWENGWHN